jgi:hypothetical protein
LAERSRFELPLPFCFGEGSSAFTANKRRSENWILPLLGDKNPFQAAPTSGTQFDGNFSPDGRWLAYFPNENSKLEVYVVPFPGQGGKYQISHNGGVVQSAAPIFEAHLVFRLQSEDLIAGVRKATKTLF